MTENTGKQKSLLPILMFFQPQESIEKYLKSQDDEMKLDSPIVTVQL